ncbi:ATP-binding protein [Gilvimarinus sp. 1_MG-2023]|uniref:ATP-binding protein n=1 Tax=Gilvimarinus sp. 1_MG-2023 TaxID=3062638 RepID=UPI0026E33B26|nr:ATP-binding protein [Gilvimarinus sp. 1_MG-2023]MDO6748335.1 ATP-binding protein [Gilvimarinus sp. 1_MG-2023]
MQPTAHNRTFIYSVIAVFLVYVGIVGALYQYSYQSTLKHFLAQGQTDVNEKVAVIEKALSDARSEVNFVSALPPVQGMMRAAGAGGVDPHDGTRYDTWVSRLNTIFEAFLHAKPSVSQVRYIGFADNGRELVRAEHRMGGVVIVAKAGLQAKGDRSYMRLASSLSSEEVGVTPLELNREFGKIQYPEVPTFRTVKTIYDTQGNAFGAIIINYDAQYVFDLIDSVADGADSYLMNHEGHYLLHPNPNKAFAFERNAVASWQEDFQQNLPELTWREFARAYDGNGNTVWYLAQRILWDQTRDSQYVYQVYPVSDATVREAALLKFLRLVGASSILLMVGIAIVFYYQRSLSSQRQIAGLQVHYKAIVNSTLDSIFLLSTEGRIQECNSAVGRLFLCDAQKLLDQNFIENFVAEADQELCAEALALARVGHAESLDEVRLKKGTADIFYGALSVDGVRDLNGRVVALCLVARDVSEQIQTRHLLQKSNDSLEQKVAQRTDQLEEALAQAKHSNESKGIFLANMSHEIRTPINGVYGMLNLLRRDGLSQAQTRYLTMAEDSVKSLTTLVNDILDFSKIEANKLELEKIDFDLGRMLQSVLSTFSVACDEKSLILICDTSNLTERQVNSDPNRLRQILNNLISNAVKFTQQGYVRVEVSSEQQGGRVFVRCSVQDTGMGISPEVQDKLFNPFEQGDTSRARNYGGTGLGLSICWRLCQLLGGAIELDSEPNKGSVFRFQVVLDVGKAEVSALKEVRGVKALLGLSDPVEAAAVKVMLQTNGAEVLPLATFTESLSQKASQDCSDMALLLDRVTLDETAEKLSDFFQSLSPDHRPLLLLCGNTEPLDDPLLSAYTERLARPLFDEYMCAVLQHWRNHHSLFSTSGKTLVGEKTPDIHYQPETVLVVDDHTINQEVMRGLLEGMGLLVAIAKDGQDALKILKQSGADRAVALVFMDCQMPIMNGYDATRAIRDGDCGETVASIPIVALTAGAMDGERQRCLDAGMNEYLSKPINVEALIYQLDQYLERVKWQPVNDSDLPAGSVQDELVAGEPVQNLWDKSEALARLSNSEAILTKIISMYVASSNENVERLMTAVTELDRASIGREAHTIKGVAANLSAEPLVAVARQLEQGAECLPQETLASLAERLNHIQQRLLIDLRTYLAQSS